MLTERKYGGEFLLSEAPGTRSREAITVGASQTLLAGAVIGAILLGSLSVASAAIAGATGNGTLTGAAVAAGTPVGVYRAICIEAAANAGTFRVEDPAGVEIGEAKVAVAFNKGGLSFTINDGATDFVAGDGFTLTVTAAAGSDQYVGVDPAATNGSQAAAGILYDQVTTASGETAAALAIVRDAEVIEDQVDFGTLDTGQKAAAKAQLQALGIVFR